MLKIESKIKNTSSYQSTRDIYAGKLKELQAPEEDVVVATTSNEKEETFIDTYGCEVTHGITEYGDGFYGDNVRVSNNFFDKARKLLGKEESVLLYNKVRISEHPQFGIKNSYDAGCGCWGECYTHASSLLRYAYDIICVEFEKTQSNIVELFKNYKLEEYINPETNNLCIDTGSMIYKKINGVTTQKWVEIFLRENPNYDMNLLNDKHVAIPHYIIYRRK